MFVLSQRRLQRKLISSGVLCASVHSQNQPSGGRCCRRLFAATQSGVLCASVHSQNQPSGGRCCRRLFAATQSGVLCASVHSQNHARVCCRRLFAATQSDVLCASVHSQNHARVCCTPRSVFAAPQRSFCWRSSPAEEIKKQLLNWCQRQTRSF